MNYWYKNLKKSFFFKPIIYELNHYRICIFYRNNLRILFSLKNRKEICIIVGSFRSVNQDSRMAERNGAKSAMNAIFGAIDDEIPFFYPRLDYTRCSELWRRSIVVNLGKGNEFRLFVCQQIREISTLTKMNSQQNCHWEYEGNSLLNVFANRQNFKQLPIFLLVTSLFRLSNNWIYVKHLLIHFSLLQTRW